MLLSLSTRARSEGTRMGRQAPMMPALGSTVDQIPPSTFESKVNFISKGSFQVCRLLSSLYIETGYDGTWIEVGLTRWIFGDKSLQKDESTDTSDADAGCHLCQ